MTQQDKLWIFNICHDKSYLECSIVVTLDEILNFQYMYLTCLINLEFSIFGIPGHKFSIFGTQFKSWIFSVWHQGQILNFKYLASRSNLEFAIFSTQVKSWIFDIWHDRSNLEFSIFITQVKSWIFSIWHDKSNLEFSMCHKTS